MIHLSIYQLALLTWATGAIVTLGFLCAAISIKGHTRAMYDANNRVAFLAFMVITMAWFAALPLIIFASTRKNQE